MNITTAAIILLLFLSACNSEQNKSRKISKEKPVKEKTSKFQSVLDKYKTITLDTFHVFTSGNLYDSNHVFYGRAFSPTDTSILPANLKSMVESDINYFACYKFSIDSSHWGLLTRSPSYYDATSVKLLLFDKIMDSVTGFIELAEFVGDAGDVLEKNSWLFRSGNNKTIAFLYMTEKHDNRIDDEKDTTVNITPFYNLIGISREGIDTITTQSDRLKEIFAARIQMVEGRKDEIPENESRKIPNN